MKIHPSQVNPVEKKSFAQFRADVIEKLNCEIISEAEVKGFVNDAISIGTAWSRLEIKDIYTTGSDDMAKIHIGRDMAELLVDLLEENYIKGGERCGEGADYARYLRKEWGMNKQPKLKVAEPVGVYDFCKEAINSAVAVLDGCKLKKHEAKNLHHEINRLYSFLCSTRPYEEHLKMTVDEAISLLVNWHFDCGYIKENSALKIIKKAIGRELTGNANLPPKEKVIRRIKNAMLPLHGKTFPGKDSEQMLKELKKLENEIRVHCEDPFYVWKKNAKEQMDKVGSDILKKVVEENMTVPYQKCKKALQDAINSMRGMRITQLEADQLKELTLILSGFLCGATMREGWSEFVEKEMPLRDAIKRCRGMKSVLVGSEERRHKNDVALDVVCGAAEATLPKELPVVDKVEKRIHMWLEWGRDFPDYLYLGENEWQDLFIYMTQIKKEGEILLFMYKGMHCVPVNKQNFLEVG